MVKASLPEQHIEGAKRRLAHLGGLAQKTAAAESNILAAAEDRLKVVDANIAKLRPRAVLDTGAGDSYQAAMLERGQLLLVIAKAGRAIAQ